jgi:DNA topoisomerase-2
LHDAVAPAESQDMAMDAEDTSKNDYNYLLSMPLWNLTLEKKEEILRQQREKSQELNNIKVKTPDQLWLDDLDEFRVELEKVEAQEKEDMQMTVKKSLKNQDKHTKSSSGFNVNQFLKRNLSPVKKYEYLPSSTGERVVPKIDTQLIDKCIKEAQQKEITKAKKDDDSQPKVLSLVDAISAEANTFTAEEMKQITEMAEGLANPNKAK